ncbi:MAG: helix-turn-helix domain-containing protein, partial [Carnobacterium maltaromaticum]
MLEIGKKIKELRLSKKLTQKDLAKILNVTPQAISKWERNESNPDIQMLVTLSKYFNISVDDILGNKNENFFGSFLSKIKGNKKMEKVTKKKQSEDFENTESEKKVLIFDIVFSLISDEGQIQTQFLTSKLELLLKKSNENITVKTYSSDKVDQYGAQADVLLLVPTFGYAKDELEKKFPGTP